MGFLRRLLGGAPAPQREPEAPQQRERVDLRRDLLPEYELMLQGPELAVVGGLQVPGRDRGGGRGRKPAGHKAVVNAALVAEPANRYDADAIAVVIAGRTCGYLARAGREALQAGHGLGARARDHALLPRRHLRRLATDPDGSWADFGITLYIASPEKILNRGQLSVAPADRPYANTSCPYCKVKMCLAQGQVEVQELREAVYVRSGPDGMRYLLQEVDLAIVEAAWAESGAKD